MDNEPDYITLCPHAHANHFLVAVMTYVQRDDEYVIKKISERPLKAEAARGLARMWAAAMHLEMRGVEPSNTIVEEAVIDYSNRSFEQLVEGDLATTAAISMLTALLEEIPVAVQAKALPIIYGMLLGHIDGQPNDAEIMGRGFITYDDHKRVGDILIRKAYMAVVQSKVEYRGVVS